MIVFDVSALVGAAIWRDSGPELALRRALLDDELAVSEPIVAELLDVLAWPRLQRFLQPGPRDSALKAVRVFGVLFASSERVTDRRDPKDDKYLELALAAGASTIVSSDSNLIVLDPWRRVRIVLPADYVRNWRE